MTHRPPNGLLVFLCQAISVSPSTSLLVRTCWLYTDRSADHTVLSSHVALTDVRQLTVVLVNSSYRNTSRGYGSESRLDMFSSAVSSGSASSLRSIRCVRALSRYTPSPDLLSNRSSTARLASIITVQLLTDAGLLQVHAVNVVAPYTDIYTKKCRQISSASLPERHVRVPKQSYIDFGDNFNFGELVCRRV